MSSLILCGFKGSGKTTLSKKISERLGCVCIDTDELVAHHCRDLYLSKGPEAFRQAEKRAVQTLQKLQNVMIATGGGTVLDATNVATFKKLGKIVYLRVPKEEIKRRMFSQPLPAFLDLNDPHGSFDTMYQSRLGIYVAIADYTVDNEVELWEVIHSEPCFASLRGESLTGPPLELSSMDVQQGLT